MARLPRFQESGLISADIQRMDFANLREEAKLASTVGDALTRVSDFAFGEVKKENDRANKLTAIQVRAELEGEVQRRMAELTVQVETGQLTDFTRIQSEVQAMRGLAQPLAELDMDQAQGLMQSIATSGKALMAKSSDTITKAYQAQINVSVESMIENLEYNLETVYSVETDPERIGQFVSNAQARVYALGVQSPASLQKNLETFGKSANRAMVSTLSKHFMSPEFSESTADAIEKLNSGTAGKYQPLWNKLTDEQKNSITDSMMKRQADLYQLQDRQEKLNKKANEQTGLDIREQHYKGKISAAEAVNRLRAINDITPAEMKSLLRGDDGEGGNPRVYASLQAQVALGKAGVNSIDAAAQSGQITWRQAGALKKDVLNSDPNVSEANAYIFSTLGVADPSSPGFGREKALAATAKATLIKKRREALNKGDPFDAFAVAQEVINEVKGSEAARELAEDKELLEKALGEAGLKYSTNYTNEMLQKAGVSQRDRAKIMRLIQSINPPDQQ